MSYGNRKLTAAPATSKAGATARPVSPDFDMVLESVLPNPDLVPTSVQAVVDIVEREQKAHMSAATVARGLVRVRLKSAVFTDCRLRAAGEILELTPAEVTSLAAHLDRI